MDILTIIGVIVGMASILGGQVLEGGHVQSVLQYTAAIIVLGGTLGAVMVQYTLSGFLNAIKMGLDVLKAPKGHQVSYIEQMVEYSNIVRKQGILSLEPKIKGISDPFFRKGLQLLVDGTEPKLLREILEVDRAYSEEHYGMAAKLFEAAGGYCPTFGIIGAVLGLIHVMENLADPSKLGSGIAVAFVATVYGVLSANLLFLPMAGKLKMRNQMEGMTQELIIEGLMAIAAGENPRIIQEKLEGFLVEGQKKQIKKG